MRTFGAPVSFVSSPETEKERFLYALESVANGFYSRHGFLVLPEHAKNYEKYTIVIPDEAKNFSGSFWRDAAKYGNLMPKVITKRMWKEAENVYFEPVNSEIIKKIRSSWLKIEKNVWKALQIYFPKEIKWISSVEIRITKIGPSGSHYLLSKKQGQHLVIYLREDIGYQEIVNLLVLALIYPLKDELLLSFTHRQTVRNFILSRPEFKLFYPFKYELYDNLKLPILLKKRSEEYIKFLGVPNIIDPVKVINQNVDKFGVKESALLKLLIDKKNNIVSYDEIADTIWGVGEFKSYWAINKLVQRIQKKIDSLEVTYKIRGVRGKGYGAIF